MDPLHTGKNILRDLPIHQIAARLTRLVIEEGTWKRPEGKAWKDGSSDQKLSKDVKKIMRTLENSDLEQTWAAWMTDAAEIQVTAEAETEKKKRSRNELRQDAIMFYEAFGPLPALVLTELRDPDKTSYHPATQRRLLRFLLKTDLCSRATIQTAADDDVTNKRPLDSLEEECPSSSKRPRTSSPGQLASLSMGRQARGLDGLHFELQYECADSPDWTIVYTWSTYKTIESLQNHMILAREDGECIYYYLERVALQGFLDIDLGIAIQESQSWRSEAERGWAHTQCVTIAFKKIKPAGQDNQKCSVCHIVCVVATAL